MEKARQILTALRKAGQDAFVVGGAVRDYLLGVVPQDIDIATSDYCILESQPPARRSR